MAAIVGVELEQAICRIAGRNEGARPPDHDVPDQSERADASGGKEEIVHRQPHGAARAIASLARFTRRRPPFDDKPPPGWSRRKPASPQTAAAGSYFAVIASWKLLATFSMK